MKKLIIMGIPHHGNLGDNAIAIAEEKMLKELFKDYKIYMLQEKYLEICAERAKKFISEEDIILLHGGGNIGDTYAVPEEGRRKVIELFPNNKIIIFPQTVVFSDTEAGRKELEISKKIYNNHKKLVIMAREEKSFEFLKEHFYNAKIYLTPDMVMTLKKTSNTTRDGALILFRTDKEKTLNKEYENNIKEELKKLYNKVTISDMNLGSGIVNIGGEYRDILLNNKFEQIQNVQLVLTDRLHGMIFSAITQTPCVALGSYAHKIVQSYNKWFKNLEYISFCEDVKDYKEHIAKVINAKSKEYNNEFAKNIIENILKQEIDENETK